MGRMCVLMILVSFWGEGAWPLFRSTNAADPFPDSAFICVEEFCVAKFLL